MKKKQSQDITDVVIETPTPLADLKAHEVKAEPSEVGFPIVGIGASAGGLGHELRNPLGAIKNATYFLKLVKEDADPEVTETLAILDREVDTCNRIINSLLDYARIKTPSLQTVNINNLVRETLSAINVPAAIEVVSQWDNSLPNIMADPDQLRRVIDNLIRNAVQAMSPPQAKSQGGRLTICFERDGSEWVVISFADTGIGIPPEHITRVFEPLFTTKAKGIGLGLALVKMLVEGHGGRVEVKSDVGKGSTFTLYMPNKKKGA